MLYVDNWYTSEILFRYLEDNGTAACGTASENHFSLPDTFKKPPLPKGDYQFRRNNNLLALRYHDKKEIFMLSTMHIMRKVNKRRADENGEVRKSST